MQGGTELEGITGGGIPLFGNGNVEVEFGGIEKGGDTGPSGIGYGGNGLTGNGM